MLAESVPTDRVGRAFGFHRRATATPAAVDRRPPPPGFLRFLLAVGFFALGDFAPTLLMLRTTEVMSPVVGTWRAATLVVAL